MQSYLEEDRQSLDYNWLVQAKSSYLKQHQSDPVNWLEWSSEAFEKAKRDRKLVFLSIGYTECHLCDEMSRESFEDEEVAKILNERFVPIKVDREERPDINQIYMKFCPERADHNRWSLNVFMTPDKRPFYVDTYIPKETREGKLGFKELIMQLHDKHKIK